MNWDTMEYQRGLNMLEMLLVITIIGIISITALKSWNGLYRQYNLVQAKQDIAALKFAVHRYFQLESCDINGNFNGNLMPSLATLGLQQLTNGRMPWITHYAARIISINRSQNKKPRYEFKLTAVTQNGLTQPVLTLIANALNAKLVENKLIWLVPINETNLRRQSLLTDGAAQCAQ